MRRGDPVKNVTCPKCQRESVVYNGNYFCQREGECGWIMPERHGAVHKNIIKKYLLQRYWEATQAGDDKTAQAMATYLLDYADPVTGSLT